MATSRKTAAIALIPLAVLGAIVTSAVMAPALVINWALPADTPVRVGRVEGFRPSVAALLRGELVADATQVVLVPARKGLLVEAIVLDKVSIQHHPGSGDSQATFHLGPYPATLRASGPGLAAGDIHIGDAAQQLDLHIALAGSTVAVDLEGENTSDIFARVISTDRFSPDLLPQRFSGHVESSPLGLEGKLSAAGDGFALESTATSRAGVTTLDTALGLVQNTEAAVAVDLKTLLDSALRQLVTVGETWQPQEHTEFVAGAVSLVQNQTAAIQARLFRLAPGDSLVAQNPDTAITVTASIEAGKSALTATLPPHWTATASPLVISGILTPSAEGLVFAGMLQHEGIDRRLGLLLGAEPAQAVRVSMEVFTESLVEAQVALAPGDEQKLRLTAKGSLPTTVLGDMESLLHRVFVDVAGDAQITTEMTAALGENGAVTGEFSTKLGAATLAGKVDWSSAALRVDADASMPLIDATGLDQMSSTTTPPVLFGANGSVPPWLAGTLTIDAGTLQFGEVSLHTVTGNIDSTLSVATMDFRSVSRRGENWLDNGSLSVPLGSITAQTPLAFSITSPIGNTQLSYAPQSPAAISSLRTVPGTATLTAPGIDATMSLTPAVDAPPTLALHGTADAALHAELLDQIAGPVSTLLAEKFEIDALLVLGDPPQLQHALLTSPSLSLDVQSGGQNVFNVEARFANSKPLLQYFANSIPDATGAGLDTLPVSVAAVLAVGSDLRIRTINGTWGDATLSGEGSGDQLGLRFSVPAHSRLFGLATDLTILDPAKLASDDLTGQVELLQTPEQLVPTTATLQTGTIKGNVRFEGLPTAINSAGEFRIEAATLDDALSLFDTASVGDGASTPLLLAGMFSYDANGRSFVELKRGIIDGLDVAGVVGVDGLGTGSGQFPAKLSQSDGRLEIRIPPERNGFGTDVVVNAAWNPGPAGATGSIRLLETPLFNGDLGGEVTFAIDASTGTLALAEVKAALSRVDLQAVCSATPWKIFGSGTFTASLNGRSTQSVPLAGAFDPGWVPAMIASLAGTGQIDIAEGRLLNINLEQDIPNAETVTVGTDSGTPFRSLASSFRIDDNVLYLEDARILTDALDLRPAGTMRLSDNFIDVRLAGSVIAVRNSASDNDMVKLGIIPLQIRGTPDNVELQFLPDQRIGEVTTRVLLKTVETLNAADEKLAKVQNSVDQKVTELLFRPLFGKKTAETPDTTDSPIPSTDPCL